MLAALLTFAQVSPAFQDNDDDDEARRRLEEFEASPYYVPLFDPQVISAPQEQLDYINDQVRENTDFYLNIVEDFIFYGGGRAALFKLIAVYGLRVISSIENAIEGAKDLTEWQEIKPEYWLYLADMIDEIVNRAQEIIVERGYTTDVETDCLYKRVEAVVKYVEKVIFASPVGGYLKWKELILFKDDAPENEAEVKEYVGDIVAIIQMAGYEELPTHAKIATDWIRASVASTDDRRLKHRYSHRRMSRLSRMIVCPKDV